MIKLDKARTLPVMDLLAKRVRESKQPEKIIISDDILYEIHNMYYSMSVLEPTHILDVPVEIDYKAVNRIEIINRKW